MHRKDDLRAIRVAEGYERLAREAGCVDVGGVRAYVGNLSRLGLVAVSLQQRPAHDLATRATYNIDLSEFGAAFGRACLPRLARDEPAAAVAGRESV